MFAQYIGAAFFPSSKPLEATLKSFAVFAVGYLARPLGGIVLSHFGDKYGRRRVFIVQMLVMSLSTLSMGLVPTYASWGVSATIMIVCLRLLQGFCLGGELPGRHHLRGRDGPEDGRLRDRLHFLLRQLRGAGGGAAEPDRARDHERAGDRADRAGASASWSAACSASSASGCACRWRRPRSSSS